MSENFKHVPDLGNQVPLTAILPYVPGKVKNSGMGGKSIDPGFLNHGHRKTPKRSKWSKV